MRLQVKVPLLVIAILLITGFISGGSILYFQRRASITQFEHMATALAGAVQGSLEQGMLTGDRKFIQEALVRIKEEEMVSGIALYASDGVIAASDKTGEIGKRNGFPEIQQALQQGSTAARMQQQDGLNEFWITTPVFNELECQSCHRPEENILGAIKVSLDARPLDDLARQQSLFIALLSGLSVVIIGAAVSFALKRTILNPLSRLADSAERFAQGDYSIRVETTQKDEIGKLSQTFNEMAANVEARNRELEASHHELARWNIDLEDKIQRRTRELTALNAVITTVSQSLHLEKVLTDALNKILSVMDIEAGAVYLHNEKTERLMLAVQQGLAAERARKVSEVGLGKGIVGQVVASGGPVVLTGWESQPAAPSLGEGFKAYVCVPLKSKNKVVGALLLASRTPGQFEDEAVHLLSAMGEAIGIGVENARTAEQLEEANKIREQVLEKLISAQEEERRRIARELHDEASQSLAALAINLETIADTLPARYTGARQKLELLKERALTTVGGIRNLALELRPSALDELGLSMAIDWYAKDYLSKRGLEVKVENLSPGSKLPSYTETMLFRIIQEALTNIVKHAEASKVKVRLQVADDTVTVQVEDNGKGFDVEAALKRGVRQNLGLHGMIERATLLGGTLTIQAKPGQGTSLHVAVPLTKGGSYDQDTRAVG
ncbi:MAG: GAF domain-containing protein [Chloroflexi bacterium]|nr:GAF domain-containing protein [Chloroflexota bacterium]